VFTYIQIFLLPLHYISSLTLSLSNAIVPFQKLLVLVAAPGMIDDLMNKVMERDQLAKEVLDLDDTVQKLHRQQTQEASAAAPAVDHAARMKELELQACRATQALEAKQSELSMATANLQNMMQEHSRFRKFLEPVIQFDEVKFDTDQNNKCVVIARTQNAIVFKGRFVALFPRYSFLTLCPGTCTALWQSRHAHSSRFSRFHFQTMFAVIHARAGAGKEIVGISCLPGTRLRF
jgi:hypothetical protein